MDQIMRLRRKAGEEGIEDPNSGHDHEMAFVKIIEKKGTLDESLLLQESFAPGVKGKLKPSKRAIKEMLGSLPTAIRGDQDRQDALAAEADPRRPPQASRRCPGRGQGDLRARRGAQRGIQPVHQGRRGRAGRDRGRGGLERRAAAATPARRLISERSDQSRLLARLRLARLHPRAARLDGAGRREARDRAGHTRPRQLLRRRRHRRAQPGAGRHAQRPHLRARPGDRALDDEHLLDLPGRPVGVPAAARRRLLLPRPRQRGALAARASPTRSPRTASGPTKTSSGCWSRTTGSTVSPTRSSGRSPASGSAPSTAATSSGRRSASATPSSPTATSTWRR